MTHNTLAITIDLSIYLIFGALVEERKLIREYGAKYLQYQEHTPMLVPVKIRVRK
jgi:protein-S-isoprenylcysteine O-methyltransferase Ste14